MAESADMDFFKSRSSPPPSSPSPNSTIEDVGIHRRTGVESCEEVLRQLRENDWEVIEIDPDPTPANNYAYTPHSYQPSDHTQHTQSIYGMSHMQKRMRDPSSDSCFQSTKQRKLSHDISAHAGTAQAERCRSGFGPTSTSRHGVFTAQDHAPEQKKPLWGSSSAKDNMLKTSSLPSPESTLSNLSAESTSPLRGNESGPVSFGPLSWSFENIGHLDTIDNSVSTTHDDQTGGEPSFERSRNPPPRQGLPALLDTMDQRKKNLEQSSVVESQRLRAQHQDQMKQPSLIRNPATHRQINPQNSRGIAQQPVDGQDTAPFDKEGRSLSQDEDDPAEIERCFDILLNHKQPQQRPPVMGINHRQRVRSDQGRVNPPNPYTREAAEKWRTQDRHLNHLRQPAQSQSSRPATDREALDEHDDDEIRLARVRATAYQKNLLRKDREAEQRLLSKKFHGVDLEDRSKRKSASKLIAKPKPAARTQTEVQKDLRTLMGTIKSTETFHETNNNEVEGNVESQQEQTEGTQPRKFLTPSLSVLNQLSSGTKRLAAVSQTENLDLKEVFHNLPEQVSLTNLKLPQHFYSYSDDEKQLYLERETKKEREKDLELIGVVFKFAAQLGSLDAFDDSKLLSHMAYLKGFTEAVLDHQKCGQSVRSQIRSIRDTFKRRLENVGKEPDIEAANEYLSVLLQPRLFHKLSSESTKAQERLSYLVPECHRINNSYYQKKSDSKRNRSRGKGSSSTKDSTGKLTGSKVSAQPKFLTAKQQLAELRAIRAQYEQKSQDNDDNGYIDLGPSRDDDDDDGEVSEEDEGEDFMRPVRLQEPAKSAVQNGEVSTSEADLKGDRRQAKDHSVPNNQPSQALDQQLLNSMVAKRQQQDHLQSQGVQKFDLQVAQDGRQRKTVSATSMKRLKAAPAGTVEPEDSEGEEVDSDIEREPSREFDDRKLDVQGNDNGYDEDNKPLCKRYVAKFVCHGLSKKYEGNEYELGKFLNKEEARGEIRKYTEWFKNEVPKCRPDLDYDDFKESVHQTKGSLEQKVIFGDGEDAACRGWFDEELYNPSKEAYQNAKVFDACQPTRFWVVDWERTIGPCEEYDDDEGEDTDNEITDTPDSSSTTHNENSLEEDTNGSESSNFTQTIHPENDHNMDKVEISEDPDQPNDSFVSLNSPVDTSLSSTAATLSSDTNDATKDHPMHDADADSDANAQVDADTTVIIEDIDDLFGGEPDFDSSQFDSPAPLSRENSPTEPLSQPPATQRDQIPQPAPRQKTVTRATSEQLGFFTTRSQANRKAKEIFMHWYIERLPNPGNWGYISVEDQSMEEELKRIGDYSCWSRDEDFDEFMPGEEVKVNNRLHVWVREAELIGPKN